MSAQPSATTHLPSHPDVLIGMLVPDIAVYRLRIAPPPLPLKLPHHLHDRSASPISSIAKPTSWPARINSANCSITEEPTSWANARVIKSRIGSSSSASTVGEHACPVNQLTREETIWPEVFSSTLKISPNTIPNVPAGCCSGRLHALSSIDSRCTFSKFRRIFPGIVAAALGRL